MCHFSQISHKSNVSHVIHALVYLCNTTYKSAFAVLSAGSEHLLTVCTIFGWEMHLVSAGEKKPSQLECIPVYIVLATVITNTQPSYSLHSPPA